MAQVAGVGRFESYGGRRRGRQHRVVAPAHPGKIRHGHVAGNAFISRTVGLVVRVLSGIVDLVLMAGHARLIGLVLRLELVPTAGSMAMQAIELARLHTGAHEPGGVRVVLSKVTTIRVIVGVFESHQTKMVEELVAGLEGVREHDRLGMAA